MGCHFLLQAIFLNQGLNPRLLCLLHWEVASLPPVSPRKPAQWVVALKHRAERQEAGPQAPGAYLWESTLGRALWPLLTPSPQPWGRLQCLTQSRWSEMVVNRKLGQRPYIILCKQLFLPNAVGEKWQPSDRETDAQLSKGTGQSLSRRASESPWGEALLSCSLILFPYIWVALPLLTYAHPSSNIRLLIQTWDLVSLKPSTFRLAGLEATGGTWKYFSAQWPRDPSKPQDSILIWGHPLILGSIYCFLCSSEGKDCQSLAIFLSV